MEEGLFPADRLVERHADHLVDHLADHLADRLADPVDPVDLALFVLLAVLMFVALLLAASPVSVCSVLLDNAALSALRAVTDAVAFDAVRLLAVRDSVTLFLPQDAAAVASAHRWIAAARLAARVSAAATITLTRSRLEAAVDAVYCLPLLAADTCAAR